MTRLRPIAARELCKRLKKIGFVMKGLFASILNDIQVSLEDFENI